MAFPENLKSPAARRAGSSPAAGTRIGWLALLLALAGAGAEAGERVFLGPAYAIGNDSIGQMRDRWQSSQLMGSVFFGPRRTRRGSLPRGGFWR
jgi:hypothetical protein